MATTKNVKFKDSGQIALTNTATLVQGYKTELCGWSLQNTNASAVWVQLFNAATAGAVTVGTTPATRHILLPASASVVVKPSSDTEFGYPFSAGLVAAATTTATGSTAPGAAIYVSFQYK